MTGQAMLRALVAVAAAAGCGHPAPAPDPGVCVPFEPYPGYRTCLLSKPQSRPAPSAGAARSAAGARGATLPPATSVPIAAAALAPGAPTGAATPTSGCAPIHQQGDCGWCSAHASAAAIERLACAAGASVRVSEPHLWYEGHARQAFGATTCTGGWFVEDAVGVIASHFLVDADRWPFAPRGADATPMNRTRPTDDVLTCAGTHRATPSHLFGAADVRKDLRVLKQPLAAGLPVIFTVPVYANTGWTQGGHIVLPAQPPPKDCRCRCAPGETCARCPKRQGSNCLEGFHAILVTGYDDATLTFTFQNSWGPAFGDHGFGRLDYAVASTYGGGGGWFDAYVPGRPTCGLVVEPPPPAPSGPSCRGRLTGAIAMDVTHCAVEIVPDADGAGWHLVVRVDEATAHVPGGDDGFTFRGGAPAADRGYTLADAAHGALELDGPSATVYMVDKTSAGVGGALEVRLQSPTHGALRAVLYADVNPADPSATVTLELAF